LFKSSRAVYMDGRRSNDLLRFNWAKTCAHLTTTAYQTYICRSRTLTWICNRIRKPYFIDSTSRAYLPFSANAGSSRDIETGSREVRFFSSTPQSHSEARRATRKIPPCGSAATTSLSSHYSTWLGKLIAIPLLASVSYPSL
jgi:hypothetical protein